MSNIQKAKTRKADRLNQRTLQILKIARNTHPLITKKTILVSDLDTVFGIEGRYYSKTSGQRYASVIESAIMFPAVVDAKKQGIGLKIDRILNKEEEVVGWKVTTYRMTPQERATWQEAPETQGTEAQEEVAAETPAMQHPDLDPEDKVVGDTVIALLLISILTIIAYCIYGFIN